MTSREVFGTLRTLKDEPLNGDTVKIRLISLGADTTAPALYKDGVTSTVTDADGYFTVNLWTNENSFIPCRYRLILSNGTQVEFDVPYGATPINIVNLLSEKYDNQKI